MGKVKAKDIKWLKKYINSKPDVDSEMKWLSDSFIIGIKKKEKRARLIYIPSNSAMKANNVGGGTGMYTLEVFKKLGYDIEKADMTMTNMVPGVPGFGETFFQYNDLADTPFGSWEDVQEIYKNYNGKISTAKY